MTSMREVRQAPEGWSGWRFCQGRAVFAQTYSTGSQARPFSDKQLRWPDSSELSHLEPSASSILIAVVLVSDIGQLDVAT